MSEPESLVERQIAQAFDDLLVNDDGAVPWSHIANARNEVLRVAAAELSALRSRCETLEASRDEWKDRAENCEKHCVPISKDGKSVFIDGPGDFEIDYDGWHGKALVAIAARDEAVAALERVEDALNPETVSLSYIDRLRLYAEDAITFPFDQDDAEGVVEAIDRARAAARATQPAGEEKG